MKRSALAISILSFAFACEPSREVDDGGVSASEGESEGEGAEGEGPPAAITLIGTPCSSDTDCGVGGACDAGGPLPATCTFACGANDCPQTFGQTLCDGHACSFRCQVSRDCPNGGVCELGGCTYPKECSTDADCDASARCAPIFPSGDEYVCTLASVTGAVSVGDACDPTAALLDQGNITCTTSAECPDGLICNGDFRSCELPLAERCTLFCWPEGVCAGPCDTDAQCPSGMKCEGIVDSPLHVCAPFSGSGAHCDVNADCAAAGEKCTERVDVDGVIGLCAVPPANAVSYGDQCANDLSTPNLIEPVRPCDTEVCIEEACGARCATDQDCPFGACIGFPVGNGSKIEKGCLAYPLCASDSDCSAGSACEPLIDADSRYLTFCAHTDGLLADGAACDHVVNDVAAKHHSCSTNADCTSAFGAGTFCYAGVQECSAVPAQECRSGTCTANDVCSTTCTADDECPIGMRCELVTRTLVDGRTTHQGECFVAAGSLTTCARDADCSTAGEICRLSFELDGTVDGRCVVPPAGSVAPRSQCNDNAFNFDKPACSTNACDPSGDCHALCTSAADCTTPFAQCLQQSVVAPLGGDEAFVSICQ